MTQQTLGILLMIATTFVFAVQDGLSRHLSETYPVMMVVGCILFFMSSFPLRSSSAAMRTTDVVPSPTSLSCWCARSTRILPAGCSTSSKLRMVAPSLVTVTSYQKREGDISQREPPLWLAIVKERGRR